MTASIQRFETTNRGPAVSQATAIEQSRAVAEVQASVLVAQNLPRDINRAVAEMRDACGRMSMAEQAFYQVPNRGTGPSVHLMRELARVWGNIEHGSNELRREDEAGISEVQAFAWDKQTNTRTSRTFIAPHERMKGGGRQRLTDLGDIQNNNNNVAARAVRECISNVLPRWFTEEAQNICRQTLEHGEGEPLPDRVNRMLNVFKGIGIIERQIEARLDKKRGQWDAGDVAQMGIVYTSITRDGFNKDEEFPPIEQTAAEIVGADEVKPSRGKSKLSGKVKDAGPDPDPAPDAPLGESEPDASEDRLKVDNEQVSDVDRVDESPQVAPGAPTEGTPGQTERVNAALGNARKMPKAREALLDLLAACFRDAGYKMPENLATVASSILKTPIKDASTLTDSQLKTVHNSLNAWKQVGTLADMVTRILDAADMQAEEQDAEQPPLDDNN